VDIVYPGAQYRSCRRIKEVCYGAERLPCPVLKTPPVTHLRVIRSNSWHIPLLILACAHFLVGHKAIPRLTVSGLILIRPVPRLLEGGQQPFRWKRRYRVERQSFGRAEGALVEHAPAIGDHRNQTRHVLAFNRSAQRRVDAHAS
jgi:hypothetical protein